MLIEAIGWIENLWFQGEPDLRGEPVASRLKNHATPEISKRFGAKRQKC
jgi:hypothetical protein